MMSESFSVNRRLMFDPNPILMPLIRYSYSVRRTFPQHAPARPVVLSWRAGSFLSFVINLHIIINSQRIDECAWFSPGITPQIKEISTDGFFCFLLGSARVSGGEICHVICHKAESKEAGKYANASDRLSLPRDERSVRYFIFLLSFPSFISLLRASGQVRERFVSGGFIIHPFVGLSRWHFYIIL